MTSSSRRRPAKSIERLLLALTIAGFVLPNIFLGPRWWVCIPATLLVGLCFGLPLFLLMRERALAQCAAAPTQT